MEDQAVCCYRHPQRETGITCTRCERPICPECMISASVGFHCPECVRGGASASASGEPAGPPRRAAEPRPIAGGAASADPRRVWLAVLGTGDRLVDAFDLVGRAYNPGTADIVGVAEGQWYRLLTAVFLHQQPMHIAFNMLSLWWIGAPLESALGRARYLTLYLLSGLGGSALSYLLAAQNQPSLGASGAVFGLLGATAVLMRRLNYDMRPVIALLVLNLIFTFGWSGIAWQAHVGGLVVGTLVAYAMVHAPRERRALVQRGACAVMLLAIVATVWVRTLQLTG